MMKIEEKKIKMNESTKKHTPSPWIDMINRDRGAISTIEAKKGFRTITVCQFLESDMSKAETKANARLVSVAPEMFDALENLIEAVGDSGHTFCASLHKWDELSKALDTARNVLDKAKGGVKDADR